jgi:hypothetical protein
MNLELAPNPASAAAVEAIKFVVDDEEYEFTSLNGWTVNNIVIEEDSTVQIKVDVVDTVPAGITNFDVYVNPTATAPATVKALSKSTLLSLQYDDVSA